MVADRSTAVLRMTLPGFGLEDTLAHDPQREYVFDLAIDGRTCPGGAFSTPLGDERWREMVRAMRAATTAPDPNESRARTRTVRAGGRELFEALCGASLELSQFLTMTSGPRRVVIVSRRPEIHQLPWEAMVDRQWTLLAAVDVSVVHAVDGFDLRTEACGAPLRIFGLFGPDTEQRTLGALRELERQAVLQHSERFHVELVQTNLRGDGAEAQIKADVLHVEAHGDLHTGELQLSDSDVVGKGLMALLQKPDIPDITLLWTCYSAMVHPWGRSLAFDLQAELQIPFVVAFATPLSYTAAAEIASRFYNDVFTIRGGLDPESAVVIQRARQYQENLQSCNWASMTLWLSHPLDLSEAVLDGPRVPVKDWGGESKGPIEILRQKLEINVSPGQVLLVRNQEIHPPLPYALAGGYRGVVVHLIGEGSVPKEILRELGIAPVDSPHPADIFLKLLDQLATKTSSLLLWSRATARQVQVVELLPEVPSNLAMVLLTREAVEAAPGMAVVDGPGVDDPEPEAQNDDLARLEELEDHGRLNEAIALWEKLSVAEPREWDEKQRLRFNRTAYWSLVRRKRFEEASRRDFIEKSINSCIIAVQEMNESEGLLLSGNFIHRQARHAEAGLAYMKAAERARKAGDTSLHGRALLELAFLASETGEARLAEARFREAIHLLEATALKSLDTTWRSALGRALRDFAHLLGTGLDLPREAEVYLRRAITIHAWDGRSGQVAYALQTRAQLALQAAKAGPPGSREYSTAEAALHQAALLFLKAGHLEGWVGTVRQLAVLSLARGNYRQCIAILDGATASLGARGVEGGAEGGRMALLRARAFWYLGELPTARKWCDEALAKLPAGRRRERAEATHLRDTLESLTKVARDEEKTGG